MNWQEIGVAVIVAGALVYLLKFMRSSVKDHDCDKCGVKATANGSAEATSKK